MPFGGASSFIIILIWVYYSTQIMLLGAEITLQYARAHGSRKPAESRSAGPAGGR